MAMTQEHRAIEVPASPRRWARAGAVILTTPLAPGSNVLGYLWLGTAGTGLAYVLWFRGIDRLPVSPVSLLALLSPLVATAAGWLVVDQRLTSAQIAGGVLVLVAMWLGQRRQQQQR